MAVKKNRYKDMERYMILALGLDALLFLLFMIVAGNGIIWLKVILTIFIILISCAILAFLYMSKELLHQRSLWMTVAAGSILICLIFSLLLNFPCPPYKP